jgi:hypothetical protein
VESLGDVQMDGASGWKQGGYGDDGEADGEFVFASDAPSEEQAAEVGAGHDKMASAPEGIPGLGESLAGVNGIGIGCLCLGVFVKRVLRIGLRVYGRCCVLCDAKILHAVVVIREYIAGIQ